MKWTDEQRTKVAEMLDAGASGSAIAAELGVTRSAVSGIIHRDQDLKKKRAKANARKDAKRNRAIYREATQGIRAAGLANAHRDWAKADAAIRMIERMRVIHRTDATSVLMGDPPAYDPRRAKWAKHLARID